MDKRRAVEPQQFKMINQRAMPNLYIVDAEYKVMLAWEGMHATGKRAEERFSHERLPPLIEKTVRNLTLRRYPPDERPAMLVALPNSSTIIRVAWMNGALGDYMAIFVERFKSRDNLRKVTERYLITPRESQVLKLLIEGARTSEIAKQLNIAKSTVILHIKSMLLKTDSHTRTEIVGKVVFHASEAAPDWVIAAPRRTAARRTRF
ncbi:MAG: helix-turn-helix transcriptional regulator [Candidatus Eremiobacteraeota bacterium]|nr:helix-turn-helix transcriptional regulator [Candidatus Eremiobacteraeota bacterium]